MKAYFKSIVRGRWCHCCHHYNTASI